MQSLKNTFIIGLLGFNIAFAVNNISDHFYYGKQAFEKKEYSQAVDFFNNSTNFYKKDSESANSKELYKNSCNYLIDSYLKLSFTKRAQKLNSSSLKTSLNGCITDFKDMKRHWFGKIGKEVEENSCIEALLDSYDLFNIEGKKFNPRYCSQLYNGNPPLKDLYQELVEKYVCLVNLMFKLGSCK